MDRKTFIEKSLGIMLIALPAYSLVNCSSDTDSDDEGFGDIPNNNAEANCLGNGTQASIGSNHGHALNVPQSDVQSGLERTYSIQGTSGHDHTVTITATDFADLQGNSSITVVSSNDDGHTHSVTVRCA